MMYKELACTVDVTGAELSRVIGGFSESGNSAQEQYRLNDATVNNCKNTEQCWEQSIVQNGLDAKQGLGHAFQLLGQNPGDMNKAG